jgi:hypothetical protein
MSPRSPGVEQAPGQSLGEATSLLFGPWLKRYVMRSSWASSSRTAITLLRRLQKTPVRPRNLLICRAMLLWANPTNSGICAGSVADNR